MLFITAATLLAALFQVVVAQSASPQINTVMNAVQCEPVQFTWQGGSPPFYLSLIPGEHAAATAYRQFPVQNGNSMTWKVDLPAGTTFTSSLKDSTGEQAFSDIQTVQDGPDSSCLSGAATPPPSTPASSTDSPTATTNSATTPSGSGTSQ
ncbi:hypothetical protein C8Q80DRAFT_1162781 [Daedaleopsis nitida]|nr:hypothetical protein C8Q80DRAFT_1162781 [Daedaleopsis nitida]